MGAAKKVAQCDGDSSQQVHLLKGGGKGKLADSIKLNIYNITVS